MEERRGLSHTLDLFEAIFDGCAILGMKFQYNCHFRNGENTLMVDNLPYRACIVVFCHTQGRQGCEIGQKAFFPVIFLFANQIMANHANGEH